MRTFKTVLALIICAIAAGCAGMNNADRYGALGGAVGYAVCSKSQALLGLCVIGGAIIGSEIGAEKDRHTEHGVTNCRAHVERRWTPDGRYIEVPGTNTEVCDSEVTRPGYRNYNSK